MGREKSKDVDKLQNSEEIGYQSLSNETVWRTGMTGVGTVDVPLNLMSNYPSFHMGDMPSAGPDRMTGASHLHRYQNFMVDPQLSNGINYMPSQYSPIGNMNTNSGGLRMATLSIKMDDSKPQSVGNSMRHGSREHLFWGAQDGREMGSNDNLVDCEVQSNYPETLDGSFLTLGNGVNTEVREKYNDGDFSTQLNLSLGQSGYGSSFSPYFRMAAGLPDFQTYPGGFSNMKENAVGSSSLKHSFGGRPSIVQNASESSNVSAFPGPAQSVDRAVGFPSIMQNASPSQMLPTSQSHVPYPFLTKGHQKFSAGFANVVPNQGFPGISGASSNGEHVRSHSRLHPNQSLRALCGTSAVAAQEQQRLATLPSLSSLMTSNYAAVTSDQLPKHEMGSIPSLQRGTSVTSVLGNIGSTSSQSDVWTHYPARQDAAVENALFTKRIQHQLAGKDKLSATDGNAAGVVSILPFSNNIGSQAATDLGQFRNNTPVQASNNLVPAYTSGPVIPFAGGNGPAIASNRQSRSSLKRKEAQPTPATPRIQRKRTTKPSPRSSALDKAQNAPSISHVPSVAHPTSSVPPVRVTPHPPVRATTIPASARTIQSPHIKRQERDPPQPSGHNCFLCKRDLSYEPEGPISPTVTRPPVAVLPCGHCFHDFCLQRMTPEDEANNPPCIPCAIGED